MELTLRHQNIVRALRLEMGWPACKPANDAIAFSSGKTMDIETGMELARIAKLVGKDVIHAGWAAAGSTRPTGFSLAYREMLTVDVIDRLLPFAADDEAPLILVNVRGDEHFALDRRGSLTRIAGRPKAVGKGRDLAMKRIKAAAAMLGTEMLANNRFVPTGATSIEPEASTETIVRFG